MPLTVLSGWSPAPGPFGGWSPAVSLAYPGLSSASQAGPGDPPGRAAVLVDGPPDVLAALAADPRFPPVLPPFDLAARKTAALAAFDLRTQQLLAAGFEWPAGSGHRFSLLPASTQNWLGLADQAHANLGGWRAVKGGDYPVYVASTGNAAVPLGTPLDIVSFTGAAYDAARAVQQGAAMLGIAVSQAADAAGVDAVVDAR